MLRFSPTLRKIPMLLQLVYCSTATTPVTHHRSTLNPLTRYSHPDKWGSIWTWLDHSHKQCILSSLVLRRLRNIGNWIPRDNSKLRNINRLRRIKGINRLQISLIVENLWFPYSLLNQEKLIIQRLSMIMSRISERVQSIIFQNSEYHLRRKSINAQLIQMPRRKSDLQVQYHLECHLLKQITKNLSSIALLLTSIRVIALQKRNLGKRKKWYLSRILKCSKKRKIRTKIDKKKLRVSYQSHPSIRKTKEAMEPTQQSSSLRWPMRDWLR